jgi:hypothetical protein
VEYVFIPLDDTSSCYIPKKEFEKKSKELGSDIKARQHFLKDYL